MMHEIMMMLADTMPEEVILSQMKEALAEYEANPSKDTRAKFGMLCMLFSAKETIDNVDGGLDSVLARMYKSKKGFDMLDRLDPKSKA